VRFDVYRTYNLILVGRAVMNRVIRRPALSFATLALVLVGCGGDGGGDKAADSAANDEILAKLPAYPGATVHDKSVNPYFSDSGGQPLGHTTNVEYEVPPGTDPAAVAKFYSSRLPDWRCSEEREIPTRIPSGRRLPGQAFTNLHCRRGNAILGVNTDNLIGTTGPRYGYEVAVDHNDRTG
jgi:hypothetical protein